MSLLDDLNEEHHLDLLQNGNLRPKPRVSNWTGENQWQSHGYIARVLVTRCECGAESKSLQGIMHREVTPNKIMREQALDVTQFLQFPQSHGGSIHYSDNKVRVCPSCLETKGFQNV